MVLPMLIEVVVYVVYCVAVVLGRGCAVRISCCSVWISSATLCSPKEHCRNIVLVRAVPFSFVACYVSERR
jgi:hypothetical protein